LFCLCCFCLRIYFVSKWQKTLLYQNGRQRTYFLSRKKYSLIFGLTTKPWPWLRVNSRAACDIGPRQPRGSPGSPCVSSVMWRPSVWEVTWGTMAATQQLNNHRNIWWDEQRADTCECCNHAAAWLSVLCVFLRLLSWNVPRFIPCTNMAAHLKGRRRHVPTAVYVELYKLSLRINIYHN